MCKNDLCGQIIALVSEVAEVEASDIMSGNRRPDVVDARHLAIYLMLEKGVQIYRVALFMGLTERNVYHVKERFEDRRPDVQALGQYSNGDPAHIRGRFRF